MILLRLGRLAVIVHAGPMFGYATWPKHWRRPMYRFLGLGPVILRWDVLDAQP